MTEHVFISECNPHITSWICRVELGPITISKMISKSLQDTLVYLLSVFAIESSTNYVHKPNSIVLVVKGCIKESHIRQNISGGNSHLTSRFCDVMLDITTISKTVQTWSNDHLHDFVAAHTTQIYQPFRTWTTGEEGVHNYQYLEIDHHLKLAIIWFFTKHENLNLKISWGDNVMHARLTVVAGST